MDPLFRPMIPEGGPVKGLQFCREFLFTDGDVGCIGNRSAGALDDILYCLVIYRGQTHARVNQNNRCDGKK